MTQRPDNLAGGLSRRHLLAGVLLAGGASGTSVARVPTGLDADLLDRTLAQAERLSSLHALVVAHNGETVLARALRGPALDVPVNVKSVAKTWIATLVGIAIDRGLLEGVDQKVVSVLGDRVPDGADPRVGDITIGHLLSMQAGLERTSGPYYGRWVTSDDWVAFALGRPFVAQPGGRMLYSTGNSHLLSAVLTRVSGRSTLDLARDWLGGPLGIPIPPWQQDPQGIYFGGNNMALSPQALLRLGEAYRQNGSFEGEQVVPEAWIPTAWTPRTRSPYTGDAYGYGWFIAEMRGHPVYYAWGYGGQMLHVVPDLDLTVVMTSDPTSPSGRTGYARILKGLLADGLIPAAKRSG